MKNKSTVLKNQLESTMDLEKSLDGKIDPYHSKWYLVKNIKVCQWAFKASRMVRSKSTNAYGFCKNKNPFSSINGHCDFQPM